MDARYVQVADVRVVGCESAAAQPVTQVSWFAAQAYCEAQHARLPDWYEWELAAAEKRERPRCTF
jgi:formylglycine-generating enzyme required for sulfatase activity